MLSVEYIPMQYYDAILIQFTGEDGMLHTIIVDGGHIDLPKFCYTERLKKKLELIFSNGNSIDLWIVTHIDNDHIGGLYSFINDSVFFETYHDRLKEVWMNYGDNGDFNVQRTGVIGYNDGKKLRDAIVEKHVCIKQNILAGELATISDAIITVVAPNVDAMKRYLKWWNSHEFKDVVQTADGFVKGYEWDYNKRFKDFDPDKYEEDKEVKNNSSIAFIITFKSYRLLFAADSCTSILKAGLEKMKMYENGTLKLDFMHIPHHGSSRNTSIEFLRSIHCQRYMITGNGENRYKLPDKETIARLIFANPSGCEIHFTQLNSKLKEIFEDDEHDNLTIVSEAIFNFT